VERRVVAFQKKCAQEGSPSAQYQLGLRYLKGEGVPKDLAEARKWLSLAAKDGHSYAKRKLEEMDTAKASPHESAPSPSTPKEAEPDVLR
jgi:TPR repeat protein